MTHAAHYTILETLLESEPAILYRAVRNADGIPVLLKVLNRRSPGDLECLTHELEIEQSLPLPTVVRPLALETFSGRPTLVLEDCGYLPADRFIGTPMPPEAFLELAMHIAAAVSDIHRQGIVHKDLKPHNILIDPLTRAVILMGFGLASRLPGERRATPQMRLIEGSLPYMAPEQTARLNRPIDTRTDLYALGVTFFEMLTGRLPFEAHDPLEWIHCHIARIPPAPAGLVLEMPDLLSRIVLKLLAKMADDRYQTARGLELDLARALESWRTNGRIDPFPIAARDFSDRLQIPQKLYGRDAEVSALLRTFEGVIDSGIPALVLVAGSAGVGKSMLVQELQGRVAGEQGFFVSGKNDRFKNDIPYFPLVQAFKGLVLEILAEPEDRIAHWRQSLLAALGAHGQLIVDVIPQVELVIGSQPPIPALAPLEAQNRFRIAFRHFIGVFTRRDHPLVLFLDDLQWADAACIELLEDLLTHPAMRYLLIVGSYRRKALSPGNPLERMLERRRHALAHASSPASSPASAPASAYVSSPASSPASSPVTRSVTAPVTEIELEPLSTVHITALLSDTLRQPPDATAPLARLILEKSGGNPFFAIQFLTTLYEQRLLELDQAGIWRWDLTRIIAEGFTDNVIELLIEKLERLPVRTRDVLKLAACLGDSAEVAILARLEGRSASELHEALWEAVRTGLLIRSGEHYRFLHDRVQEATYSLVAVDQRPEVHLRIGRILLEQLGDEALADQVFAAANQLNRGIDLIRDPSEREALCGLNLLAGRKARAAIAYASARDYQEQATRLLPADAWANAYEETFALYLERSECEYLVGDFACAEALFTLLLEHARTHLDRARVHRMRLRLLLIAGSFDAVVKTLLEALCLFGMEFPEPGEAMRAATEAEMRDIPVQLAGRQIAELIDAPVSVDPEIVMLIGLIVDSMVAIYAAAPAYFPLLTARAVNLSLRYGNTVESCITYAGYAVILASVYGDFPAAFAFSELAMALADRFGNARFKGLVLQIHGNYINFYQRHIATDIPILEQAYRICLEAGNLAYADLTSLTLVWHRVEVGDPLEDVVKIAGKYASIARGNHSEAVYQTIRLMQQFARCLQGDTRDPVQFGDETFDEAASVAAIASAAWGTGQLEYLIMKQIAAFSCGRYSEALEFAERAAADLSQVLAMPMATTHRFYHALILTELYPRATALEQARYRQTLEGILQHLRTRASACPENFESRRALVSAELARVEGRHMEAMHLYEQAIRSARENGFLHYEALGLELAAGFCRANGLDRLADTNLLEARACSLRWGAIGKVRQIDQLYSGAERLARVSPVSTDRDQEGDSVPVERTRPRDTSRLYPPERRKSPQSETIAARADQLDLLSIVKASQTLSSEIVLNSLVRTLLQIVLEQGGAQKALLILERNGELVIEAEAVLETNGIAMQMLQSSPGSRPGQDRLELPLSARAPAAILRYVRRTRETAILDDAAAEAGRFSGDAYLAKHRPRSVLCLPILRTADVVGLLYLENNLVVGAFTPERLLALELITAQAAISLENARLVSSEKAALQVAEEAIRGRDEFLSIASHELRTPLTALQLSVQGLRRGIVVPSIDALQHTLRIAERQTRRLASLIDDLLDVSRIHMGVIDLQLEDVDGAALVRDVASRFDEVVARAGSGLTVRADEPVHGHWDTGRLDQILTNLLANAAKFGAGRPIEVSVEQAGGVARFVVRDQGIGIPPDRLPYIFKRFERAVSSRNYGGLGLGLYIVHELVGALGGTIRAESTPGAGSVFTVELPCTSSSADGNTDAPSSQ